MIIKIAEIADIHWGALVTITSELYKSLKKNFIDKLLDEHPDVNIIAICGDLFHTKLSMTSDEAMYAVRFIHELRATFPDALIILVKGTRSHDLNQLDIFNSLVDGNFKIYNTVTEDYYTDKFRYLVIPEEYYPDKSAYDKYLNSAEKYDWVFFHGMFDFAGSYALIQGSKFNKICFSPKDFKDIVSGKVVGGHIHDPLDSHDHLVEYCGSFERWKHGEDLTKGWRYHEYDTNENTVLIDQFVINPDARIYKTIGLKDIDANDLESTVITLNNLSKNVESLRIKILRDDNLTDTMSSNLVSAVLQFPNVSIYKEQKIKKDGITDEEKMQASEERKKRIKEYEGLTFSQITIKYAKDVLNKEITEGQIQEILSTQ